MKSRILGWNYGTQLKEFGIWFKIGISWIQFLESGFKRGIQNPSLSWIYIITCTGREVSRQNNVRLLRTAEILENTCKSRKEGEIGVYGIAVLSFFMRYFGIIFVNGIAVSSSPAVFGFHPFGWRYLVKEDPSRRYYFLTVLGIPIVPLRKIRPHASAMMNFPALTLQVPRKTNINFLLTI